MIQQVNFGEYAVFVDNQQMGGVQSLSLSKDIPANNIVSYGSLSNKIFYGKPTVNISIERVLSDNAEPFIITGSGNVPAASGYLIQYYGINGFENIQTYDFSVVISGSGSDRVTSGGTSMDMKNCVLNSMGYSFTTDGNFTESLSFAGHSLRQLPSSLPTSGDRTGVSKRRQDFDNLNSIFPNEVTGLLSENRVLKGIDISIGLNWNEIPVYGYIESYKNKMLSLPIDISCNFQVLDRGYEQEYSDFDETTGRIDNSIYNTDQGDPLNQIKIVAGGFTYDLGTKNYITSISRDQPSAGDGAGYAIYTYSYKNSNNYFKLLRR